MRLVAYAYQQEQRGRVSGQHDWIFAVGQKNSLLGFFHGALARIVEHVLLGKRDDVDLIEQPGFLKDFNRYIKLSLAAVNYPEVGKFTFFDRPSEPAAEDLVHAGEIVLTLDRANTVAAAKRPLWRAPHQDGPGPPS